ncbi:MAG: DUF5689 domain-containing protein [Bacteroidales bacterium]|nr:DUF5689 domain-containing protein [Bacteroidales bacterium]
MKNIIKITIVFASVFVIINGCVKENFDVTPEYVTTWQANTSISELRAMYVNEPVLITEDIIIKGVVISSDENGNFYKELFIQEGKSGIGIEIDQTYLYEKYPIGKMVYVKCKGLYLGMDYDVMKLGSNTAIDRIKSVEVDDYIDISTGGTPAEPMVITLDNLANADSLIGSLIKIENVQFDDPQQTYVAAGEHYAERSISDCSGNSIILSTSEYVDFKNDSLPAGNGTISAILSKFSGNYQLRINSGNDVNFIGTRCAKQNKQ